MSIYKNLGQDDTTSFKTNLYEQIPVTGTIIRETYGTFPSESNIHLSIITVSSLFAGVVAEVAVPPAVESSPAKR